MVTPEANLSQAKAILFVGVLVMGFGVYGLVDGGNPSTGDVVAVVLGVAAMLYAVIVLAINAARN